MPDTSGFMCPACGAPDLTVDIQNTYTCLYCNSQFLITSHDGNPTFVSMDKDLTELYYSKVNHKKDEINQNLQSTQPPNDYYSNNQRAALEKPVAHSKKKNRVLLIVVIILAFLCLLCFISAIISGSSTQSSEKGSATAKFASTRTATPNFINLPYSVETREHLKFQITKIQAVRKIGGMSPQNDYFIIIFTSIQNQNNNSKCVHTDDFSIYYGSTESSMDRSALEAAKNIYGRNYPGSILGQCIASKEKIRSILVFDVPYSNKDWSLLLVNQKIKLGDLELVFNPPPTATTTSTTTLYLTETPTQTPTLSSLGKVSFGGNSNIRTGPGTDFQVTRVMNNGDGLNIYGRSPDSQWLWVDPVFPAWVNIAVATVNVTINELPLGPTPNPTATKTPIPSPTLRPTATRIPAISIEKIYQNYEKMTEIQFRDYVNKIAGKPVRQFTTIRNVSDNGKVSISGPWSPSVINFSDFCVALTGVPKEIALGLDGGESYYLQATISGVVGNYNYYSNCENTLVLIYKQFGP